MIHELRVDDVVLDICCCIGLHGWVHSRCDVACAVVTPIVKVSSYCTVLV